LRLEEISREDSQFEEIVAIWRLLNIIHSHPRFKPVRFMK
jgi:hypothetical protein